ncbi:sulfatase-like hydrolase/transferase, partial [Belliella pelovolcani]|uniref:sulfatase-like hydrolase/transferase n=1 Tax=Belliella pelovolcani TaxID=529505 RepID=UPI00391D2F02
MASAEQPNIIFILTDDLGYGDIGVLYQNQRKAEGKPYHQTPNIDQFANEGIILTRHYAPAPVCAPSRASLMLGVHQGHADIRDNQFDKALPNNHNLASVLKQAGYQTGLIGKWGLQGREGNSPDAWEAYPTKRGFDYFFGYVRHGDGHNHYPA